MSEIKNWLFFSHSGTDSVLEIVAIIELSVFLLFNKFLFLKIFFDLLFRAPLLNLKKKVYYLN